MRKFISRLLVFISFFIVMMAIAVVIPPTPRAATAHLFSKVEKDSLLKNVRQPRIILIGGSNISMSINSQLIRDSLDAYPINTGISASIGLLYMLDHALLFIKPGDIVIVCPEYSQFYDNLEIGTEDLLRIILDTSPSELLKLRTGQLLNSLKYLPRYALTKFKPSEYQVSNSDTSEIYLRTSFNEYGDLHKHWSREKMEFEPLDRILSPEIDLKVLAHLCEFQKAVVHRGGYVFLTFPAIDEVSYRNQRLLILLLEQEFQMRGFSVLGCGSRYKMASRNMFDTPYHLTALGVEIRTHLLIEDLKKAIVRNQNCE